ncbi:ABC transporter permease [Pseudoflavonifractor sp. 60]|uniref:ABC transporter permease n=1 Tax=Pseudoflavonifractor sp. 60 TaxID=2304576 RepID=UPI0013685EC6|nr:ABC transporter permease [Pseudoflavonifractor sp. 60]NBI65911.1 ABC transporter permease [Pseudoflavonifractor sp. 60]
MNLVQAFKMAFKSIYVKKTRSFLTMLGIIIGVASVVIMVSVVAGQNKQQMAYMEMQGNNIVQVNASSWTGQDMDAILNEYVAALDKSLVVGISPDIQLWNEMIVRYGGKSYSTNNWETYEDMIQVVLGNDSYGICNNYELADGRELSFLDIEKENNVCVLGAGIKEKLFNYTDPLGETITINGLPYLVIGWYQSKSVEGWEEVDNVVLLPYTVNRTLNQNQTISRWKVKCATSAATSEVTTRIQGFLDGMFPVDENGMQQGGWGNAYSNNTWQESRQEYARMQTLVMGGIACISLIVGGIGIMNIMLVTVTERTREIGIRKAIGAERRSIIAQFLIEAAVICGIGGILGIIIGCMGSLIAGKFLLNGMILWPAQSIVLGAFLFSVVLGVIFGMYPAVKASGLQPVEALRAD